ncbi:peptide chain release factor N(5)-glutamine methyltransferase [Dysgonomonas sp. ZJ279]|uniref:peptide chain release factor N(5)-glutamine methyltransferase n=1 Tax=Dysgonomonas sp. ZJ279 TaxID=2709796 RepID=UPI0013EC575C|nr:peptide chain release factor N(5)-glutamine methyltransferase [Dysgonomonas sp. ZJ279]
MQTAIDYIHTSLKELYPETEISGFTRIIIEHTTGRDYRLALIDKTTFSQEQVDSIHRIVERLMTYEPIQYILGETEFFGLPFSVNSDTLIPRPETEELVELILNENKEPNLSVLDIGTGSGCIAIALAKHLNSASVSAWDFSQGALDMAGKNTNKSLVNVDFARVDVLSEYPVDKKFDIIVSNPPYVLESEKTAMDNNVLDYEPHTALFVPDNKALLFYERIADIALNILKPTGKLYFEINQAKGKETIEMLKAKGFINIALHKDLSKRDRMINAELKY